MTHTLHLGDCRTVLATLDDASIDAIVCDPPYELGFMGKSWDNTGIAYDVTVWQQCLRVLKPGGHLVAFGGSRTYHRLAVAIEDAGFEIRDQIQWIYASGFPKSLDVSKAMDKQAGAVRDVVVDKHEDMFGEYEVNKRYKAATQTGVMNGLNKSKANELGHTYVTITAPATDLAKQWDGWGTALKPAHEPAVLARKPLCGTVADNVRTWGVGALNIDGTRVEAFDGYEKAWDTPVRTNISNGSATFGTGKSSISGTHLVDISANKPTAGRWPANVIFDEEAALLLGEPSRFFYTAKASKSEREAGLDGMCTVKYDIDKSIIGGLSWNDVSTVAVQLLQKVTSDLAALKWHIGESGENITALYPSDSLFTTSMETNKITALKTCNSLMHLLTNDCTADVNCVKTDGTSHAENAESLKAWMLSITNGKTELALGAVNVVLTTLLQVNETEPLQRNNIHSTVKPLSLMRYLVRLVTPKGGKVLDPFMGSGSTGCAAVLEGCDFVGIDITPEYVAIAQKRIAHYAVESPLEGMLQ